MELELENEAGIPFTIVLKPMGLFFSILLGDRKFNVRHRGGKLVITEVEKDLQVSINNKGEVIL